MSGTANAAGQVRKVALMLGAHLLERVLARSPRMRLRELTGQATGALVLAGGPLADA